MRNPYEVLIEKEERILGLRREIEALQLVIRLLGEEKEMAESQPNGFDNTSTLCFRAGTDN